MKIKIPSGGYTQRDMLVRKETLEEVIKMINDIKLTNTDYAYSNDYIDDFLFELKGKLRNLKENHD